MKWCLLVLCLFVNKLQAQLVPGQLKDNGVYLSDSDFIKKLTHYSFNKGEGTKFRDNSRMIIAVKKTDTTYKFYLEEIWGYRRRGSDWRLIDGESYQIDYTDSIICIYTLPGIPAMNISNEVYFSVTPSSPVHYLSRKNLVTVFHSDSSFVNSINSLPLITSIFKWDKLKQRFQFINWLSTGQRKR